MAGRGGLGPLSGLQEMTLGEIWRLVGENAEMIHRLVDMAAEAQPEGGAQQEGEQPSEGMREAPAGAQPARPGMASRQRGGAR